MERAVGRTLWWIGRVLNATGTRRLAAGRRAARRWWSAGDWFIDAGTHLLAPGAPTRRSAREEVKAKEAERFIDPGKVGVYGPWRLGDFR